MTIYEKLNAIQTGLHAPKGQRNDFGKYNYRSCEDILEAVKPLLKSTQTIINISDEIVEVGGRVYIKATASLFDTAGSSVNAVAFAREEESKKGMDSSQVTGAASSYARKYALNGLFAIDDTKDSDATNDAVKESATAKTAAHAAKSTAAKKAPAKPIETKPMPNVCSCCGKKLTEYRGRSAEDWARSTNETFGRVLCGECGLKMYAEHGGKRK